jgi:hypothetical protein
MSAVNPHDSLVRTVFSDLENAVGELRSVLPPAVADRLEWATLKLEPGSFVDPELRDRHTDLLFSVNVKSRRQQVFIYVLLEHQSSPDHWMALRLLRYMLRIWEWFLTNSPDAKRLPAILPLVLAHGPRRWNAPMEFLTLMDLPEPTRKVLRPFVPNFRYALDDLARFDDAALLSRAMTEYAKLTLFFLQNARSGSGWFTRLGTWGDVFRALLRRPTGARALTTLVHYVSLVVDGPVSEEFRKALEAAAGPEVKEVVMTWAETLRSEGETRGEARGRAGMLLEILTSRGLVVTDPVREQILGCRDLATLRAWGLRAVTVASAEEVVAPGPSAAG